MKSWIFLLLVGALAGDALAPADARPRRNRRPAPHYTFPAGHVEERVNPYADRYARVTMLSELVTKVREGQPLCRLEWTGRRVDAVLPLHTGPFTLDIPLPRGSTLRGVDVYLVAPNGEDAEALDDDVAVVAGDTLLVVTVPHLGDARVVDVQYRLEGYGLTVDERFLFQPAWPVLKAEYRFSVSRDLWQDAADQGLAWEFSAATEPRTWQPRTDDSPEYFTWYWRDFNLEPVEETQRTARAVSVTGYLPAPILAGLDPSSLPDVHSLTDVSRFQDQLVNAFESEGGFEQNSAPGGYSAGTSTEQPTSGIPSSISK